MSTPEELTLFEEQAPNLPLSLFSQWYEAALQAQLPEPSAMTLATTTTDGLPSARIVLMRGYDERGISFYTNYESRKGEELAHQARAALVFYWAEFMRQVRIEGTVERVSAEESDRYFSQRPFGHRLGALVSPQSQIIPDRHFLETRLHELQTQYQEGDAVPRPTHWGGYRVDPLVFEFWQGRPNRLHDRLRYRREGDSWIRERLSP